MCVVELFDMHLLCTYVATIDPLIHSYMYSSYEVEF